MLHLRGKTFRCPGYQSQLVILYQNAAMPDVNALPGRARAPRTVVDAVKDVSAPSMNIVETSRPEQGVSLSLRLGREVLVARAREGGLIARWSLLSGGTGWV